MRTTEQWLTEYGTSHQNPTNKLVHWICVPLIFFSIVGFFYALKLPIWLTATLPLNIAMVLLGAVTIYYFLLSRPLSVGMALFSLFCLLVWYQIETAGFTLWRVALTIFVLAWVGQFWGHKVEGKKPSFFKDIQFLMIGPMWLMHFIYKKLKIGY